MEKTKIVDIDKRTKDGLPEDVQDTETTQRAIDNIAGAIEHYKKQLDFLNKKYDLMIEHPKPMHIQFEYEMQPEWEEVTKQAHKLVKEVKVKEVENQIHDFEVQKKNLEKLKEDS